MRTHWIAPDLPDTDPLADCFTEFGEATLELIRLATGKPVARGREIFRNALGSAELAQIVDEYGERTYGHRVVGDWAYQDDAVTAD